MSKREYFAAIAFQEILSNPELFPRVGQGIAAKKAVGFADKLITELSNPDNVTSGKKTETLPLLE